MAAIGAQRRDRADDLPPFGEESICLEEGRE
jgi:hypothetical protein